MIKKLSAVGNSLGLIYRAPDPETARHHHGHAAPDQDSLRGAHLLRSRTILVVLGVFSSSCGRNETPAGATAGNQDSAALPMVAVTAAQPQGAYVELDAGAESPLGFSGPEAAAVFAGTYTATIQYQEGTSSALTIDLEPNGEPLQNEENGLRTSVYAYDLNGSRGPVASRGVQEGAAVHLAAELTLASADGRFSEVFESARLRAFSLNFARLEVDLNVDTISGTFTFAPEHYSAVGAYIDLYLDGDHRSTSGWVGASSLVEETSSGRPVIEDLALWCVCQLNSLDAGAFGCLGTDAGL